MTPWLDDGDVQLYHGDVIDVLQSLPAGIAQTCVTSPPYWGLRSYLPDGHDDKPTELGLEATPDQYVERLVTVFREVWRVLRPDGTVWLNLGDSYAGSPRGNAPDDWSSSGLTGVHTSAKYRETLANGTAQRTRSTVTGGLKPKDLVGVPWRVAFALQTDGWYLRSDIVWSKPNPMPESVVDRPTKAHEYLFLLSKRPRYYFDQDAIREPNTAGTLERYGIDQTRAPATFGHGTIPPGHPTERHPHHHHNGLQRDVSLAGRNRRSVWTIPTEPFPEAHFATFPQALVRPCILAGSAVGDTVLDPFIGSGTTALVARNHARRCIGIDLSAEYLAIAARRLQQLSLLGGPA